MTELICSRTGATVHVWDAPSPGHFTSHVRNAVARCGAMVKEAYVFPLAEDVRHGDYRRCSQGCADEKLDRAFPKEEI